jgi:nucleotide-binding universal stress UspA family protein
MAVKSVTKDSWLNAVSPVTSWIARKAGVADAEGDMVATTSTHPAIVVGVDGSPAAAMALQWGAREAVLREATLMVVHAIAPSIPATQPGTPVPPGVAQWQKKRGRRIIDDALTIVGQYSDDERPPYVDGELLFSGAVSGLVDLSKEADLIVVGCGGRGGPRGRPLGSISSALIHHARCPVALIHASGIPDRTDAPVLVGVDGSPCSELATAIAFDEASRRNVGLTVLHACSDASLLRFPERAWPTWKAAQEQALTQRLEGWRQRYPDVAVQPILVPDEPARRLLQYSDSAQLLVVGSHGRGGYAGMLVGAVAAGVAQSARIPVIVARKPQA